MWKTKRNLLWFAITVLIAGNIIVIFCFKSELVYVKNMFLLLQEYSAITYHQPSIRVYIHYTTLDGSKKEISTYDDKIDVGNEAINIKLINSILEYRNMYMVCSCNPLDITITEKKDKAMISIRWMDKISILYSGYE